MCLINGISSGKRPLSEAGLSQRTRFLIQLGHSPRRRLWVVGSLEHNPPVQTGPPAEVQALELFLLALNILWKACRQATLGQAIIRLRTQWYRRSKFHRQTALKS